VEDEHIVLHTIICPERAGGDGLERPVGETVHRDPERLKGKHLFGTHRDATPLDLGDNAEHRTGVASPGGFVVPRDNDYLGPAPVAEPF
jgi:hypothetical protein